MLRGWSRQVLKDLVFSPLGDDYWMTREHSRWHRLLLAGAPNGKAGWSRLLLQPLLQLRTTGRTHVDALDCPPSSGARHRPKKYR